ncbi:hypothetical protein TREES_T100000211 [Tupaia chinensis]|uniref:Uncharacterized protein n=1 Tax=Tupaia chinensis TaxID=246437 RepID=L9L8L2_TUPCH|nr:hypothetical protein TREES_T100000211 [Tupaia chinensis]
MTSILVQQKPGFGFRYSPGALSSVCAMSAYSKPPGYIECASSVTSHQLSVSHQCSGPLQTSPVSDRSLYVCCQTSPVSDRSLYVCCQTSRVSDRSLYVCCQTSHVSDHSLYMCCQTSPVSDRSLYVFYQTSPVSDRSLYVCCPPLLRVLPSPPVSDRSLYVCYQTSPVSDRSLYMILNLHVLSDLCI